MSWLSIAINAAVLVVVWLFFRILFSRQHQIRSDCSPIEGRLSAAGEEARFREIEGELRRLRETTNAIWSQLIRVALAPRSSHPVG